MNVRCHNPQCDPSKLRNLRRRTIVRCARVPLNQWRNAILICGQKKRIATPNHSIRELDHAARMVARIPWATACLADNSRSYSGNAACQDS
jgi:hypothetical protein